MGRSKFPGKPSRLASKKRVSVLVATSPLSTSLSPSSSPSPSSSSPAPVSACGLPTAGNEDTHQQRISENSGNNSNNNRTVNINNNHDEVIKQCDCQDFGSASKVVVTNRGVCAKCNLSPKNNNGYSAAPENVMSSQNSHDSDDKQKVKQNYYDCYRHLLCISVYVCNQKVSQPTLGLSKHSIPNLRVSLLSCRSVETTLLLLVKLVSQVADVVVVVIGGGGFVIVFVLREGSSPLSCQSQPHTHTHNVRKN